MKFYNSNERYHQIFAGILILCILAIFTVSICGVGISDVLKEDDFNHNNVVKSSKNALERIDPKEFEVTRIKTGNDDGSIDHRIDDPEDYYVEPGAIEFVEDNIESDLPICVYPEWGEDKWVVFKVKGGYQPWPKYWFSGYGEYSGFMTITDKDGNIIYNEGHPGMFVGWFLVLDDYWTEWEKCNTWTYYNFTFDPWACDNWIVLESSYKLTDPVVLQPDKYYKIHYDTHWKACQFDYILAHEKSCPKIPNSRFIKFSPVECEICMIYF